jgi:hypothetical protein
VYDGYFLPKGTHVHPLEWYTPSTLPRHEVNPN